MIEHRGNRRPPRVRNLIAFSALIMLLFCVIISVQATRSYDQALAEGKTKAERLTQVLSDHAALTFHNVDLTLRRAVEKQYYNTLFGGNLETYMEHNLRQWVNETGPIAAMIMVNEKGKVEVAAHKRDYQDWLDYRAALDETPLFARMKESSDRYIYIGPHAWSGDKQFPLILMARKITRLDGEFGGFVAAAVEPSGFSGLFNSVDQGRDRQFALLRTDRTLLTSMPKDAALPREVVQDIFTDLPSQPAYSLGAGMRKINKDIKIYAYRALRTVPVIVTVMLDEDDFLAEWREARIKDIGFLATFIFFGSVLTYFALAMARQIEIVEKSEQAAILASQAKTEFLANMSHELRTPLNAIIGFSEMMSSGYFGPLNAKQKERLRDVHLCGSHLLQLISDILEFSKGDAGRLQLTEDRVDMAEIIREAQRMMGEKIKGKNIQLTVEAPPGLPQLWGDKRKIRQILINLLSNAVKFTPEGGRIAVAAKLDAHRNMNLIVADTGIGIAEEDIPTALSVFGQVHRGQSHEGTGLGLPLCRMLAEIHGGKMALTSAVGEGTTVRIIFPAQRVLGEGQA